MTLPFDRGSLRLLPTSPLCDFPEEWTERLPGFFFSELPDVFQASADLIDTLLDLAEHADGKPAQVVPAQARVARPADGNRSVDQKPPKERKKRQAAEPLIAERLMQRPHDTAAQVADAVGCSVGVVAESKAWKLNQRRLKGAKQHGSDPKAVKLDERAVNAVGGGKMRQLHHSREQTEAIDDALDKTEKALFQRIGVYKTQHPQATPEQVASAIGCTAGDVECRQATLNRLVAEQGEDQLEDVDVEDPGAQRGKQQKWVRKRV